MSSEKETLDVKVLVVVCDEKRRDEETKRRGEKVKGMYMERGRDGEEQFSQIMMMMMMMCLYLYVIS